MKHILLAITLILGSYSVSAEDIASVFQIEVIFFEHNDPNRFNAEDWPKYVGKLDTKGSVNLNQLQRGVPDTLDTLDILDALDDVGDKPTEQVVQRTVTLVEPKQRILSKQAEILKKSQISRFIDHAAWMQPLASNVLSTPIYIKAGKDKQEIQGIVTVKPAKNLYQVHIDFIFTDLAKDKNNKSDVSEFRITKDLKLKKREIYYLDHPIIGAIIVVSPVVDEY